MKNSSGALYFFYYLLFACIQIYNISYPLLCITFLCPEAKMLLFSAGQGRIERNEYQCLTDIENFETKKCFICVSRKSLYCLESRIVRKSGTGTQSTIIDDKCEKLIMKY